MPLKKFWFLSNQVDRIRAERDLRQIQLLASVGSVEAYKNATDYLKDQAGTIYVWEPEAPAEITLDPETGLDVEFDREGLRALKAGLAAAR